ncbi:MAG: sugar transferase [Planctomycetaceae bacterium]|nr:sugar transferase [Planctomycetaceae bacterium]
MSHLDINTNYNDHSTSRNAGHRAADVVGGLADFSWYALCKATGDIIAAIVLFILTAPLMVLSMILVKLTSRGPVIYSQTRLGRGGRPFTIYKIRTMLHDSEAKTGPRWSTADDPRITPVGRFLRRTHLDELPQLYNILRGEMSLMGPRPERPEFVAQLERAIPRYRERLVVRPGVTGLAQVHLPPDTDLNSVRRKLVCDLFYIAQLGFWLDLRILVCTALGLLGIPYATSRKILRVPSPLASVEIVTQIMPSLIEPVEVGTQMHPA